MLKEALTELAKQAVSAAGPQQKEIDPTKFYAVVTPDGGTQILPGVPSWRKHAAQDLETIVAFAERFDQDGDQPGSSIWYSRSKIVCLVNDLDRRESVTVKMTLSDQIMRLQLLDTNKPLIAHRELLFALRTVFTQAALEKFPKLIDLLRKVSFEAGSKSEAEIQRGRSSVGKSLSAAATFQEQVPEQITLSVPVFTNSFARRTYDVQCALEIHEAEQKFQLFPLPGEIEKAFFSAEADLSASLRALLGADGTVPIYFGAP